ncbi:TIGR03089 family protein [Cellulosimicrobium sp. CUA-896]|nr:TIGR03089 family protein [Cellulosimicrobium sp. CUA-896]
MAGLLRTITREPGRPRLTWYGDDGERVELSGAVLENWVNKVTNLLVEEFDVGPGTHVALDLPVHWRTVIWALGAWRTGATTILIDTEGTHGADIVNGHGTVKADVVITTTPDAWAGRADDVVAVALPALARAFDGDLPPGAVDAAAAVMTYGDQIGWVPPVDPSAVAIGSLTEVLHRDLLRRTTPGRPGRRSLVSAGRPAEEVLREVMGAWKDEGSIVLTTITDPHALARLSAAERVTP